MGLNLIVRHHGIRAYSKRDEVWHHLPPCRMLVHAAAWEIQACSIDPVRAGGLIMALASHHNSMDQMIKQVSIKQVFLPLCLAVLLMAGCLHSPQEKLTTETDTIGVQGGMKRVFGEDAAFLQRHTDAILRWPFSRYSRPRCASDCLEKLACPSLSF